MMKRILAMAALSTLAACDYIEQLEFDKERSDQVYRTAMEDYRSGHLTQAITGLKSVCAADPTNASARFQLACLLQDTVKDYLGAVCNYREYLQQEPKSDKATLATERLATCEKGLATELANKYGLNHAETERRINAELKESLTKAETAKAKLSKDIGDLMRRYTELTEENARLKSLMRAEAHEFDDATDAPTDIAEAKTYLDEPEEEDPLAPADIAAAKSLLDEPEPEAPIIAQSADAKEKRAAREATEREEERKKRERLAAIMPQHEPRPDTYVVQEGDTLYKIAVRFYGRANQWKIIRDANKAIVSTDGRVKVGQTLVLPPERASKTH